MKLTISRNELWRGIDTVLDVVPSKPAMPVLGNLLLTTEEGGLTLAATDLDLSIRTRIGATVIKPGRVTLPARTFAEIAREWPEAELSIESREERVVISGKLDADEGSEGTYALTGMTSDEFPAMPESPAGLAVDFGAADALDPQLLTKMIGKTAFAVSRDETRPVLNGILWHLDSEGIDMVATDGSRLARYHQDAELSAQVGDSQADVILPTHLCTQLVKLLGADHQPPRVVVGDSQVFFDLGDTQLSSRVIEGPYVDYEQVIPKQNDKQLVVANDRLLPAVRRVSILASSYTHQVRLTLSADSVELSATSQEIGGEAREIVPASYGHEEEEIEIGYNAVYLMEILRKMDGEEVTIDLLNSVTASLLRPTAPAEGEDYFCLLMPLRPSG